MTDAPAKAGERLVTQYECPCGHRWMGAAPPEPAEMCPSCNGADYEPDPVECWNCGGEGFVSSCFEEFACIDPESGCDDCMRRCDVCGGKGHFPADQDDLPSGARRNG